MNIHFGFKTLATIAAVLLLVLLTAYKGNITGAPETVINRDMVAAPVNPSSPTLVTCGAEKNTNSTGKTSTIVMVPCGPY